MYFLILLLSLHTDSNPSLELGNYEVQVKFKAVWIICLLLVM